MERKSENLREVRSLNERIGLAKLVAATNREHRNTNIPIFISVTGNLCQSSAHANWVQVRDMGAGTAGLTDPFFWVVIGPRDS